MATDWAALAKSAALARMRRQCDPKALLAELIASGFAVTVEAGQLWVRPKAQLSIEKREQITSCRDALIAVVVATATKAKPADWDDERAAAAVAAGLARCSDLEPLAGCDSRQVILQVQRDLLAKYELEFDPMLFEIWKTFDWLEDLWRRHPAQKARTWEQTVATLKAANLA